MDDNFIKIGTCNNYINANIIKTFLDDNNIECIIENENHIPRTYYPIGGNVIFGDIEIKVKQKDVNVALTLLNNNNENLLTENETYFTDSKDLNEENKKVNTPILISFIIVAIILILLMFKLLEFIIEHFPRVS